MTTKITNNWVRKQLTLPVRIGPRSLFEIDLDAAVSERHFSQIGKDEAERFPTEILESLDVSAAVIHSCPVVAKLPRISVVPGGIRYVPSHFPRYSTETTGDFEEYFAARFNSKSRSTLRRKEKKLIKEIGKDGSIDLRCYTAPDELISTWFPLARAVSERTYQEKLLKRGLPEDEEYLGQIKEQARQGKFRGYLLFDVSKDLPIAFLACPIEAGGAMIYDHVGHDPEYNNLSPGAVLLYRVLQDAFADESVKIFDFTEGEGDHKKRYATDETQCADVFFVTKSGGNAIKVGAHAAVDGSLRTVSDLLDRYKLKDKVKSLLVKKSG